MYREIDDRGRCSLGQTVRPSALAGADLFRCCLIPPVCLVPRVTLPSRAVLIKRGVSAALPLANGDCRPKAATPGQCSFCPSLAEHVLTVVNTDTWRLACLKGIDEPYRERVGHAAGDLNAVQPVHFGSFFSWLRGARQGTAAEDQRHNAKAHVLVDASADRAQR